MNTQTVHEPTDQCEGAHCHWHGVDEPGHGYLACGECGHLYRTAADLRRAYRAQFWQIIRHDGITWYRSRWDRVWWWHAIRGMLTRTKNITFCQYCVHDF